MTNRIALTLASVAVFFLALPLAAHAQDGTTITGTVRSGEDDTPLPGASVVLQGTSIGTATGPEGEYELDAPALEGTLVVSFVGFVTEEVPVEGRTEIDVTLEPDARALEEVVVVGYGTQRQRDITGSIAQVPIGEIENVPVNSFEEAVQGRVAGVQVTKGSGKLGQGIQVRVRGAASVTAGSDPLYVIDGIPVTTANLSGNDAPTSPLAQLNPDDIASIEILKDAAASAIYGARASNGVVLISTKTGTAGGSEFSFNIQRSWSGPTNKVDMLDAQEYIDYYTEAARNRGEWEWENNPEDYESEQAAIDAYVSDVQGVFDYLGQGTNWQAGPVDADWQDQAFRSDAGGLQVDLSARGGGENTQFFLSGSYSQEDGILIRDNYDRLTGRLNLDHQLSERLSLGGKASLARVLHTRLPTDNAFSTPLQLIAQSPLSPIYAPDAEAAPDADEDGYLDSYVASDDLNEETLYFNSLLYNDNVRFNTTSYRVLSSAYAEAQLLEGLSLRGQFGLDLLDQNEDEYYNSRVSDNTGALNGLGINAWDRIVNFNIDTYLSWNRTLAQVHNVEATLGTGYQSVRQHGASVQGEQFPNDDFEQVASAGEITGGDGYETRYRFLSYFARANYDLAGKYLFSASGRYDGSSRFGVNNRYGFFPAVSAGWILSDEPFLEDSDLFSFLKLRASYGLTGNAEIGNFAPLGLWDASSYGGTAGIQPDQTPNPDLKWERSAQLDIGLNYGLFGDRVRGEFDYYRKNTNNLLLGVNVPSTTGFVSQTRNVGKLSNWGVEMLVSTDNLVGAFEWSSRFNFSLNRNEITDLDDQVIEGGFVNRAVEGEPIGVFYTLDYAGVDPETGDALYYVNEQDENGNIVNPEATTNDPNLANRAVVGSAQPDFTGGLGNRFAFKGFELDVFFQFSYGNEIYDGGGRFKTSNARFFDNQLATQLGAWQQPGDQTDVPEARLSLNNGAVESSRYLYDGSYLRLKNVTLAYNVPSAWAQRFQVSRARVYLVGLNLLTFADYPWWDPEVNADYIAGNIGLGNEFYTAPQARTISGGVQFSF